MMQRAAGIFGYVRCEVCPMGKCVVMCGVHCLCGCLFVCLFPRFVVVSKARTLREVNRRAVDAWSLCSFAT
jgi:hypothetical protein